MVSTYSKSVVSNLVLLQATKQTEKKKKRKCFLCNVSKLPNADLKESFLTSDRHCRQRHVAASLSDEAAGPRLHGPHGALRYTVSSVEHLLFNAKKLFFIRRNLRTPVTLQKRSPIAAQRVVVLSFCNDVRWFIAYCSFSMEVSGIKCSTLLTKCIRK